MKIFKRDPVKQLAQEIHGEIKNRTMGTSLEQIISDRLWETRRGPDGRPLGSFPELVTAPRSFGLGVSSEKEFRTLFDLLKRQKKYGLLTETLNRVCRKPGAPKKNITNSDDFVPFVTPSRSPTSLDKLLPRLERENADLHAKVCNLELTPHAAGVRAGIAKMRSEALRYGACDLEAVRRLSVKAQSKLAGEVFDALALDAQCTLLARKIEVHLGPGLAEQWRKKGLSR